MCVTYSSRTYKYCILHCAFSNEILKKCLIILLIHIHCIIFPNLCNFKKKKRDPVIES